MGENEHKVAVRCYDIHGIVKFKVITKDRLFFFAYFDRFCHEFEYFLVNQVDEPDFIVKVGPFQPDNQGCYLTEEGAFYIKEGYFYTKDSYKTAQWEVEISDIEAKTIRVRVCPNFSGYLFFGAYIIDFLLRVKLNQKGYPLIHGSGLVKDNAAFLFPARSGTGKTVTTMHFLEKGYQLLGDNFVVVHPGKVLSFPSSMNIFYYNLAPNIRKNLPSQTIFWLKLKRLLFQATFGYIKIFTPVSVKQLFPDQIVDSASLKMICLMQVGQEFSLEKIDKPTLIKCLLYNNQMDAFPFIDYITEYAFIYPDSWLARHWETLQTNYEKALEGINDCYRVIVPRHIDNKVLKQLENLINA